MSLIVVYLGYRKLVHPLQFPDFPNKLCELLTRDTRDPALSRAE